MIPEGHSDNFFIATSVRIALSGVGGGPCGVGLLVRAGGDASLGSLSQEFVSPLPPAAVGCQSSLMLTERSRCNAAVAE